MGGRWFRLCRFNPPAHPHGRGRAGSGPSSPSILPNPPYPGSASPAEAISFTTCFLTFFHLSVPLKMVVFLPLQGPQNRPKTAFWPKVGSTSRFFGYLLAVLAFAVFFIVWGSILFVFQCFFSLHFSMSVSVFSKPPNLQIYWQGQYFLQFSGFVVFAFFFKK